MGEIMDDTTTSAVLARRVRDQILFFPESHQQDITAIGVVVDEVEVRMGGKHLGHQMDVIRPTKGCVAGWACHLNGDLMIVPQRGHDYSYDEDSKQRWDAFLRRTYPDDGPARVTNVNGAEDGKLTNATLRASELLGLESSEWKWLFADERARAEVLHALDLLGKGDREAFARLIPRDGDGEAESTP